MTQTSDIQTSDAVAAYNEANAVMNFYTQQINAAVAEGRDDIIEGLLTEYERETARLHRAA